MLQRRLRQRRIPLQLPHSSLQPCLVGQRKNLLGLTLQAGRSPPADGEFHCAAASAGSASAPATTNPRAKTFRDFAAAKYCNVTTAPFGWKRSLYDSELQEDVQRPCPHQSAAIPAGMSLPVVYRVAVAGVRQRSHSRCAPGCLESPGSGGPAIHRSSLETQRLHNCSQVLFRRCSREASRRAKRGTYQAV